MFLECSQKDYSSYNQCHWSCLNDCNLQHGLKCVWLQICENVFLRNECAPDDQLFNGCSTVSLLLSTYFCVMCIATLTMPLRAPAVLSNGGLKFSHSSNPGNRKVGGIGLSPQCSFQMILLVPTLTFPTFKAHTVIICHPFSLSTAMINHS